MPKHPLPNSDWPDIAAMEHAEQDDPPQQLNEHALADLVARAINTANMGVVAEQNDDNTILLNPYTDGSNEKVVELANAVLKLVAPNVRMRVRAGLLEFEHMTSDY